MKRYTPIIKPIIYGWRAKPKAGMEESESGEYVKLSEIGWNRNCPETPVPCWALPHLIFIRYIDPVDGLIKTEIPRAALNDAFELRDGSVVHVSNITHWLEKPEIEEDESK